MTIGSTKKDSPVHDKGAEPKPDAQAAPYCLSGGKQYPIGQTTCVRNEVWLCVGPDAWQNTHKYCSAKEE